MFGARSGWLKSIPVSMSPTSTDGLPPVIACACGALISRMSHCSGESVSLSLAGAFGRGGVPDESLVSTSGSFTAKPSVLATFSIAELFSRSSRNDGLDDRAIATPIAGYAKTSDPSACCIVAAALPAIACCWYSTT